VFILLFFIHGVGFSQVKNICAYKAETLIQETIVQNYMGDSERVLSSKVFGIDVKIIVDTVFKKYTIMYTDKNYKRSAMIFNYQRDYFIDGKSDNPKINKLYLMVLDGGLHFFLRDYLDWGLFNDLEIRLEEVLAHNIKYVFKIKNAEKTNDLEPK
jgi:hypothetical protein